jgi:hypothetical protein
MAMLISKAVLFSLTNSWSKFYQLDSYLKAEEMQGEF